MFRQFCIQTSLVYQTSLAYLTRFFPKRQKCPGTGGKTPALTFRTDIEHANDTYSGASIQGTFWGPRHVSPEWRCPFNRGN